MKFGVTGLAVLGLFAVASPGCLEPTHKKNDGGGQTGGDGGDGGGGGSPMAGTGGSAAGGASGGSGGAAGGASGGSGGASGGSGGASGGSGGASGGSGGASGGAGGGGGGAGGKGPDGGAASDAGASTGATMEGFMAVYSSILMPKCTTCHKATHATGLAMLPDAATAYGNLVGKKGSANCMMQVRVVAGDPTMSLLSKKISATPGCGARMPKGGMLTAPEIKMIDDWIKGP